MLNFCLSLVFELQNETLQNENFFSKIFLGGEVDFIVKMIEQVKHFILFKIFKNVQKMFCCL
jgi:hypothetical protein